MSRGIRGGVTRFGSIFATALVGIVAVLAAGAAHATTQTLTVTTTADSGSGSLRDAITTANGDTGDTINFNITGPGPFTITLTSGPLPTVLSPMSIVGGTTPATAITIDGNNTFQVFVVGGGETFTALTLKNLTIAHGNGAAEEAGGAIEIAQGTASSVLNCTFSDNTAGTRNGKGGAIAVFFGTLDVTNSTFSGNSSINGGAIYLASNTTLNVTNSTFSGNSSINGGAITVEPMATANIKGTILAHSTGGNCQNDGTTDNEGYNVSDDGSCKFGTSTGASGQTLGDNVSVLPTMPVLGANGGPTDTFALHTSSAAIDAIPFADCTVPSQAFNPCTAGTTGGQLTCDQRGEPRPDPEDGANGPCDIGAYEFQQVIDCSTAVASNPNLTALLPVMFFPEYVFGVNDQARPYTLKITGVTQDKKPTGFPLCPNAFWSGTTTYLRTNNEPLQPGPGPLLYQIEFTATDNATGQSCAGAAPVCVKGLFQSQACRAPLGTKAASCPPLQPGVVCQPGYYIGSDGFIYPTPNPSVPGGCPCPGTPPGATASYDATKCP